MVDKEQIAYMNGPKHRLIERNGIVRHVPEQREGPLVLLCHGLSKMWCLFSGN